MVVPRKSLGQNFLRDENVARNIVGTVNPGKEDVVLEIGPGTGVLTAHLVPAAGRYIGVEIDRRSLDLLRMRFPEAEFVEGDILAIRLSDLRIPVGSRLRIVGNIPYYITSEILFWVLDQRMFIGDATLMMQWEVAKRLTAQPRSKDYGILSVVVQMYMIPEVKFRVSANSFYPKPAVDSAVVHLGERPEVPPHPETAFRTVVRGTFGKRRKTLLNSLRYLGYSEQALRAMRFDLGRRPEELTGEEFLELTRELERCSPRMPISRT
ncbi:MAG: ribosomal RNA small subunit methyltransferase A [Ignavibacteriales bacterium]|nr:ribosomal RNA small subunit methyltransferase A [Ignavibacteriales bacterium]